MNRQSPNVVIQAKNDLDRACGNILRTRADLWKLLDKGFSLRELARVISVSRSKMQAILDRKRPGDEPITLSDTQKAMLLTYSLDHKGNQVA